MNADWRTRYELMVEASRAAGNVALSYFDKDVNIEWKADQSPVTIADKNAEAVLRERITQFFPGDGIEGEEHGLAESKTGYRWIIDPIDGTRCFIRNIPLWATLVGLEYKGEMIGGVAFEPVANRMYRALRGEGAYRDDRKIHVSKVDRLADSLMSYSGMKYFQKADKEQQYAELLSRVDRARGYGDYFGFVLVAQGSCEIMLDHGVHIWDIAGLQVIVEEAGGKLTDWEGGRTDLYRPDCVATNGLVHEEALAILKK